MEAGTPNLWEMSDASLVVAIARWNEAALQEVYRRHAGSVCALGRRLLGDRARSEDIAQEVFLSLWNEPDKFDPARGSLRTYLLTRTHSRSIDLIRSETSRRRREDAEILNVEMMVDDLERQVVDLAMTDEVKQAFEELPDSEKNVIELTYFQGHTYREAARLLNEPEGTVKSRIRVALKHLRSLIPMTVEDA